jgi:hypothetical protein
MKLISSGQLDVAAVTIAARADPAPRIQIRFGAMRLTMTVPEAVTIAAQLADAADELRADTQREETAP